MVRTVSSLALIITALVVIGSPHNGLVEAASFRPAQPAGVPPTHTTDFIPCSDPCNGGDVNYELVPQVRTFALMNYTYRGRTYSTGEGGDNNKKNDFMGPTMRVQPGQSLWIKLRNEMHDTSIGPRNPSALDYWKMLQNPGEHIKYQYYAKPVANWTDMKVDEPNIAGHFDVTNLHLHGLDVQVHMFDPVGTHRRDAPPIAIHPGECYCYRFHVPEHHPTGMYWYHPHAHGSSATQIWGGMLGLLYVDAAPGQHDLVDELARYGVSNTQEFVIWDPALKYVEGKETHNLEVDEFLMGQTTLSKIHPFLINGQINPTFTTGVGEVLHLRTLCATIENENTFIIYREGEEDLPWDDAAIPFWVMAADGVTFPRARRKTIMVFAGGQRHELLLQFDKPGRYVISQQGIQGMQFFDMYGHPHDQILATIVVDETVKTSLPIIPIEEMVFTPGYPEEETIQSHDVVSSETIVFSMGADRDKAPFPQYYVNGKPFAPGRIDFFAHPGEVKEYILINANHNVHPFHIHVNRFQIQEMGSELSTEKYPVLKTVLDFEPSDWRDTVIVPPNGRARIWIRYKEYTGKTVFHCHFLAHEDTGMMSTLFIGEPDYVFYWKDHLQLLTGLVVGIVVSTALLFMLSSLLVPKKPYSPVTMNELKSKVQD